MPENGFHDVPHDGLHFRCRLDGTRDRPWMVFSNSLMTNLSLWDDQVAAFGDRFRILRYDQRGHGGTDVPPDAATVDQLANDAAALMARFGVTGAVFVGVSMGAATGLRLAQRADGNPVARLVAADGNAATPPGGDKLWQDRVDAANRTGMEGFAGATLERWFAPASRDGGDPAVAAAMAKVRRMIATTPFDGFVACVRMLQNYDVRAGLGRIACPTLLLAGEEDGAVPATLRAMAADIPGARFQPIPAAGHLPCIEQPAAFNAALESFLS